MVNFKRTQSALAGRFTRTEHTTEYSTVKCIGAVWADTLTQTEVECIKEFYQYPSSARHEIINASSEIGNNGYIKIFAE